MRRRDLHAALFYGWYFAMGTAARPMPQTRDEWRWGADAHRAGDALASHTYAHHLKNKERVVDAYNAYYAKAWGEPPLELEGAGLAPPRRDTASCAVPPADLVAVPT
jgi:hypothetical protein